jgi:hypothetical protein
MSVHLYEHKLSYFSVPKCASSSLKHFFFEIENGFPFRAFVANGKHNFIHATAYPAKRFEKVVHPEMADHWKMAVIRDPIDRVVSCYRNRIIYHQALSKIEISDEDRASGVTHDPDLATFVRHLGRYRALSRQVGHHTTPLTFFLGGEAAYFDALYTFNDLDRLVEDVRERVGRAPELARHQTGGPAMDRSDLTQADIRHIEDFYQDDYQAFGQAFGTRTPTFA